MTEKTQELERDRQEEERKTGGDAGRERDCEMRVNEGGRSWWGGTRARLLLAGAGAPLPPTQAVCFGPWPLYGRRPVTLWEAGGTGPVLIHLELQRCRAGAVGTSSLPGGGPAADLIGRLPCTHRRWAVDWGFLGKEGLWPQLPGHPRPPGAEKSLPGGEGPDLAFPGGWASG